jgi:hypothetical protein
MIISVALLFQTSQATVPPVNLNHFFLHVDKPTFVAIQNNKWLKEKFASVNVSTHSSGKETWTGIYVYGLGSYAEIFDSSEKDSEGTAGIGFLTSTIGGAKTVYDSFRQGAFGTRAETELMNLGTAEKQLPFAYTVSYAGQEGTNLNVWLMEYHADYFKRAGVPVGSSESEIFAESAKRLNKSYDGMMGDILSLTVQPAGDGKDFQAALKLFGYRQVGRKGVWKSGLNEVIVLPAQSSLPKYAVTSVRFSLRTKPTSNHVEHFGPRCQLRVSTNGTAEWRFR